MAPATVDVDSDESTEVVTPRLAHSPPVYLRERSEARAAFLGTLEHPPVARPAHVLVPGPRFQTPTPSVTGTVWERGSSSSESSGHSHSALLLPTLVSPPAQVRPLATPLSSPTQSRPLPPVPGSPPAPSSPPGPCFPRTPGSPPSFCQPPSSAPPAPQGLASSLSRTPTARTPIPRAAPANSPPADYPPPTANYPSPPPDSSPHPANHPRVNPLPRQNASPSGSRLPQTRRVPTTRRTRRTPPSSPLRYSNNPWRNHFEGTPPEHAVLMERSRANQRLCNSWANSVKIWRRGLGFIEMLLRDDEFCDMLVQTLREHDRKTIQNDDRDVQDPLDIDISRHEVVSDVVATFYAAVYDTRPIEPVISMFVASVCIATVQRRWGPLFPTTMELTTHFYNRRIEETHIRRELDLRTRAQQVFNEREESHAAQRRIVSSWERGEAAPIPAEVMEAVWRNGTAEDRATFINSGLAVILPNAETEANIAEGATWNVRPSWTFTSPPARQDPQNPPDATFSPPSSPPAPNNNRYRFVEVTSSAPPSHTPISSPHPPANSVNPVYGINSADANHNVDGVDPNIDNAYPDDGTDNVYPYNGIDNSYPDYCIDNTHPDYGIDNTHPDYGIDNTHPTEHLPIEHAVADRSPLLLTNPAPALLPFAHISATPVRGRRALSSESQVRFTPPIRSSPFARQVMPEPPRAAMVRPASAAPIVRDMGPAPRPRTSTSIEEQAGVITMVNALSHPTEVPKGTAKLKWWQRVRDSFQSSSSLS